MKKLNIYIVDYRADGKWGSMAITATSKSALRKVLRHIRGYYGFESLAITKAGKA